jgi:cation transport ATPase
LCCRIYCGDETSYCPSVSNASAAQSFAGIGGYPIFKEAFESVVERRMTMELSMTIALASALAIGEFFTTLVITAFVLGAEILEGLTVGRGRRAIQDMLIFFRRPPACSETVRLSKRLQNTIPPGEEVVGNYGWSRG